MFSITKENINMCFTKASWERDFFDRHLSKSWETDTFFVLNKYSDQNKTGIDMGAWSGIFSVFLSRLNKQVIIAEPDPKSYITLKQNLTLNQCNNYLLHDRPITSDGRDVIFGSSQLYKELSTFGKSTSQVYREGLPFPERVYGSDTPISIKSISFIDFISNHTPEDISIIKCDIESGEEELIELMLNWTQGKCPIWLSFHLEVDGVQWWGDLNISRFSSLFSKHKFYTYKDRTIELCENPIDYISKHKLCCLLIF